MNSILPPPAKARITRELALLTTQPPPGISCYCPTDNLTYLHATITGPPSTPFESGLFLLSIHIPTRYPFEPPRIRFQTPIHHPNIDSSGRICLDTLKSPPSGSWSPAVSLPSLLVTLQTLMGEPNGDDGLVAETTNQFRNDYDDWYKQARQLTVQEATDDKMILTESRIKKEILLSIENSSKNGISQFRVKRDKENDVSNQSTVMEGDEECVASSLGKRSRELEDESNMNSHESNSSRLSTSFSRLKSAKSNNASN
jgi:ubiquitin-conjugating enzyme E2 T